MICVNVCAMVKTIAVELQAESCSVRSVDPEKVALGRELLLEDDAYGRISEVYRALGDPSRARIVFALLQQELCVCDLAAVCDLSESSTSQHLRLLKALRIVKLRRSGRMSYYSVDDDHVRTLLAVSLNHVRHAPPLEGLV